MFETIVITSPEVIKNEAERINLLFLAGCPKVHVRKPNADRGDIVSLVSGITPRFRNRVVLSGFHDLAELFHLGGIHLSSSEWHQMSERPSLYPGATVSASCHSIDEIDHFPFDADYLYLSPIFDSISKEGYKSQYSLESLTPILQNIKRRVYALGGVSEQNIHKLPQTGFAGAAVLGAIWSTEGMEVMKLKTLLTPHILTIGGLDPTGGAGITKDVAVAGDFGVRAYPIATAITYQNEETYLGTDWLTPEGIIKQIDAVKHSSYPQVAKIGLIENALTLQALFTYLKSVFPYIKIVWDPILKSSTGKTFHRDPKEMQEVLCNVDVITPNLPEARLLFGEDLSLEALNRISKSYDLSILCKGGHCEGNIVSDQLVCSEGNTTFNLLRSGSSKHGTGCAHSSALSASLALGYTLEESASKAQIYVSSLMRSSDTLLSTPKVWNSSRSLFMLSDVKHMFITHPAKGNPSVLMQVELACRMGAQAVQLRMKDATDEEMIEVAYSAREICHLHGAIFTINDRVHIARQVRADGVHLGQQDTDIAEARRILGDDAIIGRTCNTPQEAVEAVKEGADYLGVGPYRFTKTKKKLAEVLGLEGYRKMLDVLHKEHLEVPIFAIGGITEEDESEILSLGVTGIALSGDFIRKMKRDN